MDKSVLIGIAAIMVTLVGGFGGVMMRLGRLEQKFDLVWRWYVREVIEARPGGRRNYDPVADDHGGA